MKISIMANDRASYVKPLAEGLARMLGSVGAEPKVFYHGLEYLDRYRELNHPTFSETVKNRSKTALNWAGRYAARLGLHEGPGYPVKDPSHYEDIETHFRVSDVIVVVSHVPVAFLKRYYGGIEELRKTCDRPIVLYDLVNLATRGSWIRKIAED